MSRTLSPSIVEAERRDHGRDVLVEALGELVGGETAGLRHNSGMWIAAITSPGAQRGLAIAGDELLDRQRARAAA